MRIQAPLDVEILKLNVTLNLSTIVGTMKVNYPMQYYYVIKFQDENRYVGISRWKWSDYDEIWHTKLGDDCDKKFLKLFITM